MDFGCGDSSSSSKVNAMIKPTRLVFVLVASALLGSGACSADLPPDTVVAEDASVLNVTLRVEGMT